MFYLPLWWTHSWSRWNQQADYSLIYSQNIRQRLYKNQPRIILVLIISLFHCFTVSLVSSFHYFIVHIDSFLFCVGRTTHVFKLHHFLIGTYSVGGSSSTWDQIKIMRIQSLIEFLYVRMIRVHIMRTWSAYFFLLLTTMIYMWLK